MEIKIHSEEDSMLWQILATNHMLINMLNMDFTNTWLFPLLCMQEPYKQILKDSGMGNPAVMHIMLYSFLLAPREMMKRKNVDFFDTIEKRLNPEVAKLVENETFSTYDKEDIKENIDYFKHIRNAVAHFRCEFSDQNGVAYVTFTDQYGKHDRCEIKMECWKVATILNILNVELTNHLMGKYFVTPGS